MIRLLLLLAYAHRSCALMLNCDWARDAIGEAVSYTSLMNETMEEAAHRMQFAAQSQGATAVVNVRFDSNTTMNRLVFGLHCSVICYGTAVVCRPLPSATSNTISAVSAAAAKLSSTSR